MAFYSVLKKKLTTIDSNLEVITLNYLRYLRYQSGCVLAEVETVQSATGQHWVPR